MGSRAWGFASRDSDYDVRFLYVRTVEWYLFLESKRDVLERQLPHDLDLTARKQQGEELDRGPCTLVLDALIEEALVQLGDTPKTHEQPRTTMTALDGLFRQMLRRYAPEE